MNSFWNQPSKNMLTWHSNNGRDKKTVDYFPCDGMLVKWCTNCRVRNSYKFLTVHRLLNPIPTNLEDKCDYLTKTLESAAIAVLPETLDENVPLSWHNNPELQQLQQQRDTMSRTDPVYKKLTKKHRILLKRLKRRMKQDALTDVPTSGCDQNLLREHFKKHFTCDTSKKNTRFPHF